MEHALRGGRRRQVNSPFLVDDRLCVVEELFTQMARPLARLLADVDVWLDRANLTRLVLGCIEAKFCNKICVGIFLPRSTKCTPLHRFGIESQKPGKPGGEKNLVQPRENWPGEAQKQPQPATHYYLRARSEESLRIRN